MRQSPVDVRVLGAKKESVNTLKTLEQASAHFALVTYELHVRDLGLQCAVDCDEDGGDDGAGAKDDAQQSIPAFILSLNAETIHEAASLSNSRTIRLDFACVLVASRKMGAYPSW